MSIRGGRRRSYALWPGLPNAETVFHTKHEHLLYNTARDRTCRARASCSGGPMSGMQPTGNGPIPGRAAPPPHRSTDRFIDRSLTKMASTSSMERPAASSSDLELLGSHATPPAYVGVAPPRAAREGSTVAIRCSTTGAPVACARAWLSAPRRAHTHTQHGRGTAWQ